MINVDNYDDKYDDNYEKTNQNDNFKFINNYNNFNYNSINLNFLQNIPSQIKKEINIEFTKYIFTYCKFLISYDTKKIKFNLQRIGNIKNILDNLQNTKKKINKQLEYNIHKKKIFMILDEFLFLMINKGYRYDYINYNYILYELKDNKNTFENTSDENNENEENNKNIYFMKMKSNINENKINCEGKTYIIFILHRNKLLHYFY